MHPGDLIMILFKYMGNSFFYTFLLFSLISYCLHKIVKVEADGIMTVSLWPTYPAMFSCYA